MIRSVIAVTLFAPGIAYSQAAPNLPSFEVASIHESKSSGGEYGWQVLPGGRFRGANMTVHALIRYAYGAKYENVHGPGWLQTTRYDVNAKAPDTGPVSTDRVRLMLQSLLADRFKLIVSKRPKGTPSLILTRVRLDANLGPGIRPSRANCGTDPLNASAPNPAESKSGCQIDIGAGHLSGVGQSIAVLASSLRVATDTIVTDRTGLTGLYDFDLTWMPENGVSDGRAASRGTPEGGSIFTAVREQLGLQLQHGEVVDETIIVERVERPTPN